MGKGDDFGRGGAADGSVGRFQMIGGVEERSGGRAVRIKVPKAGCGGTCTGEDKAIIVVDCDGVGVEGDDASGVAKLSNRNKGAVGEVRNDVDSAGRSW